MDLKMMLFTLLSLATISYAQQVKCAEGGEYCQNHWDCCSNTCFTYNLRCSRNNPNNRPTQAPNSGGFQPWSPGPGVNQQQSLQALIDSLFASTPFPWNPSPPAGGANGFNGVSNTLETRFGEDNETGTGATQKPCAKIGEHCTRHSDCCSNACHGFLHKCVT